MTSSYQQQLIESLLQDAEKGQNGASLQVQCGNEDDSEENETFFLHPCIAIRSSGYFERFPTPEVRNIQEIDAETFRECRRFMYQGSCNISHASVASILAAADMLIMKDLTKACFDFLQHNLDHDNYETVRDLAERFQSPHLAHLALRYATPGAAKKELVLKKQKLASDIQENVASMKQLESTKRSLAHDLESVERQWTAIMQADIDAATLPPQSNSEDSSNYPYNKAKSLGAVGRLVVSPDEYPYCKGVTEYDPKAAVKEKTSVNEEDDTSVYSSEDEYYRETPPPPTKAQYEELGITHAYSSFEEAMNAAQPGDRVYLSEGTYELESQRHGQSINHSQEIVSLPNASVIINLSGRAEIKVYRGSLRLAGLTFRHTMNCESGNTAMIDFESENGDIFIQDCTFDMGTNASEARSSRLSGIFLKQGKSARIERNKFIGGGGSALTLLNDPTLCFSNVEINRNVFINTGQPSFRDGRETRRWSARDLGYTDMPLPENEIVPEPAAVELWRLNRKCYQHKTTRSLESYSATTLVLSKNRFCQNMRAPLAYRALSGSKKEYGFDIYGPDRPKPKPTAQLYVNLTEVNINDVTKGFNITLIENVAESNGLGLDNKLVASWVPKEPTTRCAKKQCVEDSNGDPGSREMLDGIPDRMSLVAMTHIVESYHKGFPCEFEYGLPFDGFEDVFFTSTSEYASDSSDLW